MFPYPYQQSQTALFLGLINTANPSMPTPATSSNVAIQTPASQTPPNGTVLNTNVLVNSVAGKAYRGKQTFQYRRIDIGALFLNTPPIVTDYYSGNITSAQLATALNRMYGLNLTAADFVATSFPSQASNQTAVIASTSLCYTGTLTFNWQRGKIPVSNLFASTPATPVTLSGRVWPGGNTFGGGRLPQGEFLLYGLNCTSQAANFSAGTVDTSKAAWQAVLAFLQAAAPGLNLTSSAFTTAGGINGLTSFIATLPDATNAPYAMQSSPSGIYTYNKALVLYPPSAQAPSCWFQGKLILHFNG